MPVPTTPSLRQLLCLDLYAASRAVIKAYGPLLRKLGLTYPQYLVMVALWESGTLSVKDLSMKLSLDSGTLSPLLKRLESAGLLERARCAEDERGVNISLTRSGQALQAKSGEVMREMSCRLGMEADAVRRLQEQLRLVTRRFEE
jgi:DNA-binding MarR family transcriptional regulator